jgi:hypothetical protein
MKYKYLHDLTYIVFVQFLCIRFASFEISIKFMFFFLTVENRHDSKYSER